MSAADLVAALRRRGVDDVDDSTLTRALYSSDASLYRVVPQAVARPRDPDEIVAVLDAARELGVPVTMRGAGTSIAGNAVGPGIVIDTVRHLDRVVAIDPEARTARVQPGVVHARLQAAAAAHGLRFGPDPSTHTRCTIGGMIGNNACGSRALGYGRTADNVEQLRVAFGTGEVATVGPDTTPGRAATALEALVDDHLAHVRTSFGRFTRQVSGYSLEHLLPEHDRRLDRFLVGSEGTLATVLEATVDLVPDERERPLLVLGYPSMPEAADAVPDLLAAAPGRLVACEGIDARIVDLVARRGGVPDLPRGAGWLLVEATGADAVGVLEGVGAAAGALDLRLVRDPAEAAALWRIREDGAGLAARSLATPAYSGWEDAAVPPEHLGAWLRDFDDLLADHGLSGMPYGHFGDGCLHVRIDFPFAAGEPGSADRYRDFLHACAARLADYGGSLSGEHGDGRQRSALLPTMYDETSIGLFGAVKEICDPDNLLNPGNIVDPAPFDADLRAVRARREPTTGLRLLHDGGSLADAVHRCTGVGKCVAPSPGGVMCPSYAATRDEKDATRGRARVLQEALDGSLVDGLADPAVHEALDLCLSCKGCASDCPTGVDMATYKSEALHQTYAGKRRPRTHYTLGRLPRWARMTAPMAQVANASLRAGPVARLAKAVAGVDQRRSLPTFAERTLRKMARTGGFEVVPEEPARDERASRRAQAPGGLRTSTTGGSPVDVRGEGDRRSRRSRSDRGPRWSRRSRSDRGPRWSRRSRSDRHETPDVWLWADSFTDHFRTGPGLAAIEYLTAVGLSVRVIDEQACCGLTWVTTGQLDQARKIVGRTVAALAPYVDSGVPVVGLEPSCLATLRSDAVELVDDARAAKVSGGMKSFAELVTELDLPLPDLTGVEVVAQPHCHQHAIVGWDADQALLQRAGATVTRVKGCCGLAGNFGVEKGHYETSVAVAETHLLPAVRDAGPATVVLADGMSCHLQLDDLADVQAQHLAELFAERVRP